LSQFYLKARPDYSGRVTVPVLWDKKTGTIVNNESSEIIRMFNHAFDGVGAAKGDYYPSELRTEIDALNARIYATVNNGVYRAGFATTQEAYEEAFRALFETLDMLEARVERQRFLCGETLTEADWRLFTTLIRFDPVYSSTSSITITRAICASTRPGSCRWGLKCPCEPTATARASGRSGQPSPSAQGPGEADFALRCAKAC
jgi:putative glutathione S-transferase